MTQTSPASPDRRAIITEALRKIDDLSARLEIAEKTETEPIAVVGIGCRLPGGVGNADEFWKLLEGGVSGVIRVPADRWDADEFYSPDYSVPGTICNREGGFLTSWQPDEFDAEFFSIAPREAAAMDPQQRLLLEVAWEALENAGINPRSLRGSAAGVFVGMTTNDYYHSVVGKLAPEDIDPYIPFGNAPNFAAGRLSYFLGIRGPAVVSDTACSSSLVSIHLACQSLRRRESDHALAAGVNLILSPENNIACSRWGMLAPDGLCKTFDADADGYVRSEGCGVVVLKRLTDALRDGDRVLAVVRGSAVNQDGASSGQTVPNGPAQQELMRKALETSRLAPSDIDYIEAHGTGTALGDPIELDALSAVYGDRQDSAPLVLGSVKTNLGHLESAAGVTGFIKTVLSVHHGFIPKQLHFKQLTPQAGEAARKFRIAAEPMDWPALTRPRRAAVSSFGVSGTNAHILLEQAPEAEVVAAQPEPPVSTLIVSGKTPARIASQAGRLADWMQTPDGAVASLADVAETLNHRRAQHARFATVAAGDREQAIAGLRALAGGYPAPGVVGPNDPSLGSGTVFLYSGQGSQWAGMGKRLLADEPAFAAAVDELEPDFVAQVGFSLRDVLTSGETVVGIDRIQPVLVGVQLALTALWRAHGVKPDAVIGHSRGEVTAAVVGGALSPADGLKVIATRSRLMKRLSGQGAMALLELDAAAAEELIADHPGLTVAVYASPHQTVIAGPPEQVDAAIAVVDAQDRLARRVDVDVASHHPIIDPILDDLRAELADLTPTTPTIPIIVTTDERPTDGTCVFDAAHWVANLRNPVRFARAVATAGADNATFVEVSPHPLLGYAIKDTLAGLAGAEDSGPAKHLSLATLPRDANDTVVFHTNLTATHTVRPPKVPHRAGPRVQLPATPWHHTHHWIQTAKKPEPLQHNGTAVPSAHPDGGFHKWFHRLSWPVRELASAGSAGSWLVLSDESGAGLAELLGPGSRSLPLTVLADGAAADSVRAELAGVDHVVYAPSMPSARLDAAAGYQVFGELRRLVVALAGAAPAPRLFVVTRNAQPVAEGDRANPAHAVLWGQGRTLALEHPEFWGGLVDVDDTVPPELLAQYLKAEAAAEADQPDGDDQVVYRSGERRVPRLQPHPLPAAELARLESGTSHLVVGATGNVGPYLIRQLAEMGASTVVAVSRRGTGLSELAAELATGGTTLVEGAADAADEAAMTAVFDRFGADLPPLDGVYLASLAGGEALLTEMTDDDVNPMFRSKIDAASVLHKLTLKTPVRRFVLFSSITGLLGSRAVAHYTAANAFADAFGYARRALGLAATVVDWGLWKSWSDAQPQMKAAGLEPMPNDVAIRMLPAVLSPDAGVHTVVAGADWPRLADAYRMRAAVKVLDHLLADPSNDTADAGDLDSLPAPAWGTVLGDPVTGTAHDHLWRARLLPESRPYPVAHRVRGVEVVPVSVLLQTLSAAAAKCDGSTVVGDIRFEYPIVADRPKAVHVVADATSLSVWSSSGPDTPEQRWTRHAGAELSPAPGDTPHGDQSAGAEKFDGASIAALQQAWGVEGQPFAWTVTECATTAAGVRADVALPEPTDSAVSVSAALIDAAVHVARLADAANDQLLLPAAVESIGVAAGLTAGHGVIEVYRRDADTDGLVVDVLVKAADGSTSVDIRGLAYTAVESISSKSDPAADEIASATTEVVDWSAMGRKETVDELRVRLRAILARELGMPEDAVDVDMPFPELGLDSMMAMNLLRDAKALVRIDLSATMLWNHPSISQMSDFVAELLAPMQQATHEPAEPEGPEDSSDSFSVLDELFDSIESEVDSATAGSEGAI
ncbi:SDR family NAD(P)-dependent oxidoreductase [Mycolicibacterium hippocampi]|uniref:type I polyketide synthase n=1 Tax=Mycolicibacterium hippocampi TaxID=659824 RepID=UPI0035138C55